MDILGTPLFPIILKTEFLLDMINMDQYLSLVP